MLAVCICLNVERYCISVTFRAKVGPPLEKNPGPALEHDAILLFLKCLQFHRYDVL